MLAEELAEEEYGVEFYDLPQKKQFEIYNIALDMIDEQGMAQGGRIGYGGGGDRKMRIQDISDEVAQRVYNKLYFELTDAQKGKINDTIDKELYDELHHYAQGGRIGYWGGGTPEEGIKSLEAGASSIKVKGDERPENMKMADKYDPNDPMYKGINKKVVIEFIQEGIPLGYSSPQEYFEDFYGDIHMKKGGRVKRNVGGIMDLGGMEKDYRFNGGFVPIGGRERADDVPARLSKNEFVMTADAVRAAGGGSINKGAQRMYDTMKHLEAQPQAKRMTA